MPTLVPSSLVLDDMLFGTQKADGIIDQEIALYIVWEMSTGNEFQSGSRSHAMGVLDQVKGFMGCFPIARQHCSGKHPANVRSGCLCEKRLSPMIESNAPGVGNGQLSCTFQFAPTGRKTIKPTVGSPHGTVGCLYVGMQKNPFSHVNRPRGIGTKRVNIMVRIVVVKTTH